MKRRYERPSAYIEEFTPNEYVAACGDSGKVYKFKCNAGGRNNTYGVYYMEKNNRKIYLDDQEEDLIIIIHVVRHMRQNQIRIYKWILDDQSTWKNEKIPVYVWTERGTNVHCTLNLDMNEWATAKS